MFAVLGKFVISIAIVRQLEIALTKRIVLTSSHSMSVKVL